MSGFASSCGLCFQAGPPTAQPVLVNGHLLPLELWDLIFEFAFFSPPNRDELRRRITHTIVTVDEGPDPFVIEALRNSCHYFRSLIGKRGPLTTSINVALPLVFRQGPEDRDDYAPWAARKLRSFSRALHCHQSTSLRLLLNQNVELLDRGQCVQTHRALRRVLERARTLIIHGKDARIARGDNVQYNTCRGYGKRLAANAWKRPSVSDWVNERPMFFFGVESSLPNLRELVLDNIWFHERDATHYCGEPLLALLRLLPGLEALRMEAVVAGPVTTPQTPILCKRLKSFDFRGDVRIFRQVLQYVVMADSLRVSFDFPPKGQLSYIDWSAAFPVLDLPDSGSRTRIECARAVDVQPDTFSSLLPMLTDIEELKVHGTILSRKLLKHFDNQSLPSLCQLTFSHCTFSSKVIIEFINGSSHAEDFRSLSLTVIDPQDMNGNPRLLIEDLKKAVGRLQWREGGVDIS